MDGEEPTAQQVAVASRLPPEVVTKIVHDIAHNPLYGNWDTYLPAESIAISQVSSSWRGVSLSPACRTLWRRVPLRHSAECVRAFMERSEPLPVVMAIELGNTSTPISLSALAQAVTHMERIEEISFRARYRHEGKAFSTAEEALRKSVFDILSHNPATSLKDFTWSYTLDSGYEDPLVLPYTLFARTIPENLRRVRIVSMDIPQRIALLRAGLTSLELSNCTAWNHVDDLLETLSCIPDLNYFIFSGTIWPIVEVHQPSQVYALRSVNLPCLRTLRIRGDIETKLSAGIVFAYLRIPINARVHLDCDFDEAQPGAVTMLCEALTAHYNDNDVPDGQENMFSLVSIGLCGGNTNGLILQAFCRKMSRLSLTLSGSGPPDPGRAMITEVMQSVLSLHVASQASRINIGHSNWFARGRVTDWIPLRRHLHELRTIGMSRTSLHGLAPLLLAPSIPGVTHVFPNLSEMHFRGIKFGEEGLTKAFYFVTLTAIARYRAERDLPLQRITFHACPGATKLVDLLSDALPDVAVVEVQKAARLTETFKASWDNGDADIPHIVLE